MKQKTQVVEIENWAVFKLAPPVDNQSHGTHCLAQFVPTGTGSRVKGHYCLLGIIDWESVGADNTFSFERDQSRYHLGTPGPVRDSDNQLIPVSPFVDQNEIEARIDAKTLQLELDDSARTDSGLSRRSRPLGL